MPVNIEQKTLTSVEVAEMVGKPHNDLMKDIRRYTSQFNEGNISHVEFFTENTYLDKKGQERPCYLVTKKGCEFIAHKLTGVKGTEFTAKYINRFHELEEHVQRPRTALEQIALLAQGALELEEKVDSVEQEVYSIKNDMPLFGAESDELSAHVKRKGVEMLGGKKSEAYKDNKVRNRGSSVAMHGSLLYLISNQSFFILEATTGKVIVRKPLPYNVDVTSTPLLTDKEIIFGSAEKGLIALDNETLEEKWVCPVGAGLVYTCPYTRKGAATIETSPVLAGNTVYVTASDGVVYGINKSDGKIIWKYATGAPVFSSVAVSGNALIAADFGGNVYTFCAR